MRHPRETLPAPEQADRGISELQPPAVPAPNNFVNTLNIWKTRWTETAEQRENDEVNKPSPLASKMEVLCEVLLGLVNENAKLNRLQEILVERILISLANQSELSDLGDLGDAAYSALELATFINSCSAEIQQK